MKRVVVVFLLTVVPSSSVWATMFFTDDAAGFAAAVAAFTFVGTEDWESSSLAPNGIATLTDPIAPGVANGPFATGTNLATGLTVQSNTLAGTGSLTASPRGAGALATASAGFAGTPSDQVSTNFESDSFDMLFSLLDPVTAVSFAPLYFDSSFSETATGTITVRVFDTTNLLIGTTTISGVDYDAQTASSFMGVVAMPGESIGRINLYDGSSSMHWQGADDIDVYTTRTPAPEPAPEPGTLALLALGLAGIGLRRRTP